MNEVEVLDLGRFNQKIIHSWLYGCQDKYTFLFPTFRQTRPDNMSYDGEYIRSLVIMPNLFANLRQKMQATMNRPLVVF